MQKKWFVIFLVIITVMSSACTNLNSLTNNSSSKRNNLVIKELKRDNGTYGWGDIEWLSSIREVEKQGDIVFPEKPYMSAEWSQVYVGETPEKFYDYKNNNDYESVEYLAYTNNKPVIFDYNGYTGYMSFEFQRGELVAEMLYFGTGASTRDPLMTFENTENDTVKIREDLRSDLIAAFGEPTSSAETEFGSITDYVENWESNVVIDGSYKTRISLSRLLSDMDCVYLLIVRVPVN